MQFLNELSGQVGWEIKPFPFARPLPEDNGERFYLQYLQQHKLRLRSYPRHPENDRCQCPKCAGSGSPPKSLQATKQAASATENRGAVPVPMITMDDVPNLASQPKSDTLSLARAQQRPYEQAQLSSLPIRPTAWQQTPMMLPVITQPLLGQPPWPFVVTPYMLYMYTRNSKRPKLQREPCCYPFLWWCCLPQRNGRPPHHSYCLSRNNST